MYKYNAQNSAGVNLVTKASQWREIGTQQGGRSTYNHLSSWLTDTRNLTNPSTVIFLIGNKSDLDGQRDVTYEEAKQFADENGLMFVEASAKTGQNVEEAFLETAKKIYQSIQDGRLDLNAAESGVQHKPASPARPLAAPAAQRDHCAC
ncbi:Ras-related protein Rab-14 [Eumeta japonica]|uniref:Ras-related protein Rab-14 n=1 Tax=Eumeta variegata TaxID=151549 RepID=A0A4C1VMH7_EUMVA|nr:Ras-related protein Rab-14 [Eumeta japonica]